MKWNVYQIGTNKRKNNNNISIYAQFFLHVRNALLIDQPVFIAPHCLPSSNTCEQVAVQCAYAWLIQIIALVFGRKKKQLFLFFTFGHANAIEYFGIKSNAPPFFVVIIMPMTEVLYFLSFLRSFFEANQLIYFAVLTSVHIATVRS